MKTIGRYWPTAALCAGSVAVAAVAISVLADGPQPAITIARVGTNQFQITVTNSIAGSTNNYEWQWTPLLGSPYYPWLLLDAPSPATNATYDVGDWPVGFFRVSVEQFYNGVPDYELADPNNPSLGALSITIDSPTNGTVFN